MRLLKEMGLILVLVASAPVDAEQVFAFSPGAFKDGTTLPNPALMPGGGQISFSFSTGLVYKAAEWAKYPYKQLLVSGSIYNNGSEVTFETKQIQPNNYDSLLTIFEGGYENTVGGIDYAISCGPKDGSIIKFSAQGGQLSLPVSSTQAKTWGTYKSSVADGSGHYKLLVHSFIVLVDFKHKTSRVTFMEDGSFLTTGTVPWMAKGPDLTQPTKCALHVAFADPKPYNRYVLANIGISANK